MSPSQWIDPPRTSSKQAVVNVGRGCLWWVAIHHWKCCNRDQFSIWQKGGPATSTQVVKNRVSWWMLPAKKRLRNGSAEFWPYLCILHLAKWDPLSLESLTQRHTFDAWMSLKSGLLITFFNAFSRSIKVVCWAQEICICMEMKEILM